MKPEITLELGKDTSESELEEVCKAFESHFKVAHRTEIVRLSDGILPLVIIFTVSAVASGLYWDAIKAALRKLFSAYTKGNLTREPVAVLRQETRQYVITNDHIFERMREEEVKFFSLEDFIEYMKRRDKSE